jgi:hypothetical protein
LRFAAIIKIIVNCTKREKQGNQSKNRLVFASIFAQKTKNKIKKSGGKKFLFLKKFKHDNSHFLLANLLQTINIINVNCKTQRNTVCTRATAHATLLSSSSFPESVSEKVKSTVIVCFWGSNPTVQNFLPAIRFS